MSQRYPGKSVKTGELCLPGGAIFKPVGVLALFRVLLAQLDSSLLGFNPVQVDGCAFQLLALDKIGELSLVGLRFIANRGPEFE